MDRDRETYVEAGLYTADDLSPYSTSSVYSSESHTYYPELDWQAAQHDPRTLYGLADKTELHPVHIYAGYASHPELYASTTAALWHQSHDEGVAGSVVALPSIGAGVCLTRGGGCSSGGSSSSSSLKPKRRRVQNASQRKAANIRERKRMYHLNEAFDELRKRLPAFNYEKRLSRIETLRLAITYISFMKDVTQGEDPKLVKLKSYPDENSHHGATLGSNDSNSDSDDER